MAPREGCPLRSAGDWCSRLSSPGTPVTSFRWGRVVTITVSPGGAASPARRDAPRRSSGIPCVRTTAPGFRRGSTLPSSCHSVRADDRARALPKTHLRRQYGIRGCRSRAFRCVLASRTPRPARLPPSTGTFHAAGCVSFRAGAFDAVGDSNPVPQRARRPRPHRNVPTRAECPQPRRPSVGHPWHPEPLVRQLHQRRPPTTTSGPHTGARSGQTVQDAASSRGGEAPSRGVRAPGPVDLTLAELTRPAAQCPQR